MGNQTSKGVLVQAKREQKCDWAVLGEQCRRMNLVTKKGSVVWLYKPSGIAGIRSPDVSKRISASMDSAAFFDRVLKCEIGDKRKVPAQVQAGAVGVGAAHAMRICAIVPKSPGTALGPPGREATRVSGGA